MTDEKDEGLTCVTCKQPILVTDEWTWLDSTLAGRRRQPEHDRCYQERFARQFPKAQRPDDTLT